MRESSRGLHHKQIYNSAPSFHSVYSVAKVWIIRRIVTRGEPPSRAPAISAFSGLRYLCESSRDLHHKQIYNSAPSFHSVYSVAKVWIIRRIVTRGEPPSRAPAISAFGGLRIMCESSRDLHHKQIYNSAPSFHSVYSVAKVWIIRRIVTRGEPPSRAPAFSAFGGLRYLRESSRGLHHKQIYNSAPSFHSVYSVAKVSILRRIVTRGEPPSRAPAISAFGGLRIMCESSRDLHHKQIYNSAPSFHSVYSVAKVWIIRRIVTRGEPPSRAPVSAFGGLPLRESSRDLHHKQIYNSAPSFHSVYSVAKVWILRRIVTRGEPPSRAPAISAFGGLRIMCESSRDPHHKQIYNSAPSCHSVYSVAKVWIIRRIVTRGEPPSRAPAISAFGALRSLRESSRGLHHKQIYNSAPSFHSVYSVAKVWIIRRIVTRGEPPSRAPAISAFGGLRFLREPSRDPHHKQIYNSAPSFHSVYSVAKVSILRRIVTRGEPPSRAPAISIWRVTVFV